MLSRSGPLPARALIHVGPQAGELRADAAGRFRVALDGTQVDLPAVDDLRCEHLQVADDDGRPVDGQAVDGQAVHAFGQLAAAGEDALPKGFGVQRQQFGRVMRQIPDDQLVFVGGVPGQRPDHRHGAAFHPVHGGDVNEGAAFADLLQHGVLAAQLQAEVPELWLAFADQPAQRDGGAHVRQRIVRLLVTQPVGGAQVFQFEGGAALVVARPFDAIGPQGGRAADHVQQVPAAAAVAKLPVVGRAQRAPEEMAGDLVVEADGVVAHADGAVTPQLGQDGVGEVVFRQPLGQAGLRHDAGEQAGFGVGQVVGRRLAVDHHRVAHLVQVEVGADAGKLGRPVQARVAAEGFVVVPEEGVCGHG